MMFELRGSLSGISTTSTLRLVILSSGGVTDHSGVSDTGDEKGGANHTEGMMVVREGD